MDGVQLSQSHYEDAVYFLPISPPGGPGTHLSWSCLCQPQP